MEAQLIPSGLGRAMIRMGNALDHALESDDSGSGFGCGGGGGGGD
ncbi:hypothetical protein [Streptomyces sp. BA2]|nr:hypothetical protein [Streptomyces sp. BA2]